MQAVVAETTSNPVALIAHDMGTSVATELLARDLDGHLPFELQAGVLSNGSVILDRASLRPIQNVLHGPLARSSRGWRIAACSVVASPDCSVRTIRCPRRKQRRNWTLLSHNGGHRIAHLLISYLDERVADRDAGMCGPGLAQAAGVAVGTRRAGGDDVCSTGSP